MIKNKLTFSLFLTIAIAASKCEEQKTTVKTEETEASAKREQYYALKNKCNFLFAIDKAQKELDKAKDKTEEEKKKADVEFKKAKEAIEKKYKITSEDVKETAELLKKQMEDIYANFSYTDTAFVACNNHWKKAAFIAGAVVILVGAYKYFSCEEDYANDEEDSEN